MPFCPECKYEYVAGIAECPDCYVPLVASLDDVVSDASDSESQAGQGGADSADTMIACWDTNDQLEANAAWDILNSQSIPCFIYRTPRKSSDVYGATADLGKKVKDMQIMVPEAMATDAREILDQIMPTLEIQSSDDVGTLPQSELDETYED